MAGRGRARVVGAGVVGLTTAVSLCDDGWQVEVVAAQRPEATTSAVAAAFWYPYLVGPAAAVARWGSASARRFDQLAADDAVPVQRRVVHERFREADVDPAWRRDMPGAVREDVTTPYLDGWSFTTWVADMPRYLRWLVEGLMARGVRIELAALADLADAGGRGIDLVVDCAGIGARRLVPDPEVQPVGGQVVVVDAPVTDVWLDAAHPAGPTYVVPRSDSVVVGGTSTAGTRADATPDPTVASSILERATALVPDLAGATVLAHAIGRRPARAAVRLELERRSWGTVLHHYGHGGAGVTLSWGSAAAAARLARRIDRR